VGQAVPEPAGLPLQDRRLAFIRHNGSHGAVDLDKACGQDMKEEAPDKLDRLHRHSFLGEVMIGDEVRYHPCRRL